MGGVASAGTATDIVATTLKALTSTSLDNIFSGAATVHGVEIDATLNSGEDVYVRFWDAATATVGTTAASLVLKGCKGEKTSYEFPHGYAFSTGLTAACVQEAGGGSGSTTPSGTVNVTLKTT